MPAEIRAGENHGGLSSLESDHEDDEFDDADEARKLRRIQYAVQKGKQSLGSLEVGMNGATTGKRSNSKECSPAEESRLGCCNH
jgi:hypothetical protein